MSFFKKKNKTEEIESSSIKISVQIDGKKFDDVSAEEFSKIMKEISDFTKANR